jgi:signal transduction histidine kinase
VKGAAVSEFNIPWKKLTDAASDGVCVVDGAGTIRYANRAALILLGLPAPGGASVADWFADLGEHNRSLLLKLIQEGGRATVHLRDAEHKHLVFEVERFDDVDGSVCRIRRDAEVAASETIAILVHELRLPMTSIIGYAKMLLTIDADSLSDLQRHFLNTINRNVERLNHDLAAVQDMTRIERAKIKLALTSQRPAIVTRAALGELQPLLLERGHRATLDFPEDLPPVEADAARFKQILCILLENALKYTPSNGRIKLQARTSRDMVQIDVIDNGLGIPNDEQARIFSRFFRGESEKIREFPGLGLNLYIARELVALHGGRLWFKSTPGQGSTFSLVLPVYEAKQEEA